MKETGLLFNTSMVKAERENLKTQTRRLDGLKKVNENPDEWEEVDLYRAETALYALFKNKRTKKNVCFEVALKCPYGVAGDRLWVRETMLINGYLDVYYLADNMFLEGPFPDDWYYRDPEYIGKVPSIHMPRWASRTTLEITDIRIERVRDISYKNAKDEGWPSKKQASVWAWVWFKNTWNSVYEKRGYGWDKNPWVWVLTFKRVKGDQ